MIRKIVLIPALLGLMASAQSFAQGDVDLENEDNRIAYSIGVNIGQNLVAQGLLDGIDLDIFIVGMLDAANDDSKLSEEEMFAALQIFQERLASQAQAALEQSRAASASFLQENSAKDGVVTLASGLQYLILESGDASGASPTADNSVLAHYHGTLIDGTVFDSSVDRGEPAQFGLSQVISGWTEALQLMKVGDKWRLFLPSNLAYGEQSPTPAIPPNSALIFDVELLEIR
ncbi:MAG: FKBP-type peptidyl-prolyl cis-trans isomerase [Gammaproteobacteria bacterium]|nr:FKBP-type peptidyl-prolyl cis-trans isomerase [Gammaproteobacteria bacterium]MBT3986023.1 FKBP-type peptidyl-prolyl cis-trans isomerase [Gammaproteobacteria bacterium]MBT4256428.1 FKBP-type peptidyl-prolyl cis-trans isomerase [Gammaproteobacteria bacterium]MBT4582385.1 FKBP-type peptidyl-prolyl cis-trans isomerase [Gammaproteobacteria bacterium]MBT4658947.1 FKBP-type peptidyl-prolyl cis-trans isomerase [Gammaproteobacteria bacterium]